MTIHLKTHLRLKKMTKNLSSMTKSNLRSLKTSCLKMNSMSYLSLRKSLSLKRSYLKMSLNLKKDLLYLVKSSFQFQNLYNLQ